MKTVKKIAIACMLFCFFVSGATEYADTSKKAFLWGVIFLLAVIALYIIDEDNQITLS